MHPVPPLPQLAAWRPTRDALHGYSRILGSIRGALSPAHPRWWHLSLAVGPDGLSTGDLPLGEQRDGEGSVATLRFDLDLREHRIVARGELEETWPLDAGWDVRGMAERILAALRSIRLDPEVDRSKIADDQPTTYRVDQAEAYRDTAVWVNARLRALGPGPAGELGPAQLWPHHFDLAREWFAPGRVTADGDGEETSASPQIGYGFSTGDDGFEDAYFYANPWPYPEAIIQHPLPAPARWHEESWKGGFLSYAALNDGGPELLDSFFAAVTEAARDTLIQAGSD